MDGDESAAHDLDRALPVARSLAFGLLREEPSPDPDQAEAQLREHGKWRQGPRHRDVERLSQAGIVAGILCAPRQHLDAFDAQPGAGMDQEGCLVLIGLDQRELEFGPHDLEREAWETSAGPDVHHPPGVAQVIEQDQAVVDQAGIRPGHQPGPRRDHSCELNQLRIVHEMPIYEYRCESCSGKFDVLTRFAERDQAQVCPSCESTKTRVLVSSFAFAGTGDSSSAFEAGGGESAGGCCGGGCGSCGSSPN